MKETVIGVLGFQGNIEEHLAMSRLAFEGLQMAGRVVVVKRAEELKAVDGLIVPGGESTVVGRLMSFSRIFTLIQERAVEGMPILGTCSGLIVLAAKVYDRVVGEVKQPTLGVLDVAVERNAFGRQKESFEADLDMPILGGRKFRGVFIRAPAVNKVGPDVKTLSELNGVIVAVQQGKIVGTSFHPELTNDSRLHQYFLKTVAESSVT